MFDFLRKTSLYKIYKRGKSNFARNFYGNPSNGMMIVGVTGTDGKTTTCNLIHKIINDNLGKAVLISTVSIKIGENEIFNNAKMTSLDPMSLQKYLALAKNQGCKYAVLEVSSHGIEQYRFHGVDFDLGVLTNITSEHLDYHGTMEDYANTKKKLFLSIISNSKPSKMAVLPKDSDWGRKWIEDLALDKIVDYGIVTNASLKAAYIENKIDGTKFSFNYLGKTFEINSKLLGEFNVYNMLSATGAGLLMGINVENIIHSLESFEGVSGRMERVSMGGVDFFVDFAHTPNAIESVLKYINSIKKTGKILTVFGAPGNRDKYKRPVMGSIVERYSDFFVVTDDDPSTENRYSIIKEIVAGIKSKEGEKYVVIPEREYAIKFIYEMAKPGDIVLLAGKGHEKTQLTNFGPRYWNDKEFLLGLNKKK